MGAASRKILVLLDSTVPRQAAVREAARLAQQDAASLELYDYSIDPQMPHGWTEAVDAADNYRALLRERRISDLEQLARPLRSRGIDATICVELLVPLDAAIANHLEQTSPDLIVIDDAPLAAATLWRTQVDGALLRHARCPVMRVDAGQDAADHPGKVRAT